MAKNRVHASGPYQYDEKRAVAAITPGMLIERTSADKVQKHSSSAGLAANMFALEDALQGRAVSTDYAADDLVGCLIAQSGTKVNALLVSGTSYAVDATLESNGDGTLKTGTTNPIAKCTEALDLSASGAVNTLSEVEIL